MTPYRPGSSRYDERPITSVISCSSTPTKLYWVGPGTAVGLKLQDPPVCCVTVASEATPTQPSRLLLAPSKPSAFSCAEPIVRKPDMGDDADNVPEPGAPPLIKCGTTCE